MSLGGCLHAQRLVRAPGWWNGDPSVTARTACCWRCKRWRCTHGSSRVRMSRSSIALCCWTPGAGMATHPPGRAPASPGAGRSAARCWSPTARPPSCTRTTAPARSGPDAVRPRRRRRLLRFFERPLVLLAHILGPGPHGVPSRACRSRPSTRPAKAGWRTAGPAGPPSPCPGRSPRPRRPAPRRPSCDRFLHHLAQGVFPRGQHLNRTSRVITRLAKPHPPRNQASGQYPCGGDRQYFPTTMRTPGLSPAGPCIPSREY